MDARAGRIAALLCGAAVAYAGFQVAAGSSVGARGGLPDLTDEARAAGLRFAPGVGARDRAWVLAAVARSRPEARTLIAEVDGLVTIETHANEGDAIGLARLDPLGGITVSVDTGALNGDRALDRDVVVLHELGHVIDWLLVDDALILRLDAGIPPDREGIPVPERFADTFAKWALRGSVSLAGSGYGVPAPASLEDWGTPLGLLAARVRVEGA